VHLAVKLGELRAARETSIPPLSFHRLLTGRLDRLAPQMRSTLTPPRWYTEQLRSQCGTPASRADREAAACNDTTSPVDRRDRTIIQGADATSALLC
jgi:hypothetical protein